MYKDILKTADYLQLIRESENGAYVLFNIPSKFVDDKDFIIEASKIDARSLLSASNSVLSFEKKKIIAQYLDKKIKRTKNFLKSFDLTKDFDYQIAKNTAQFRAKFSFAEKLGIDEKNIGFFTNDIENRVSGDNKELLNWILTDVAKEIDKEREKRLNLKKDSIVK